MNKTSFIFVVGLLLSMSCQASLRLPRLFSNGMVLQRNKPVAVWGWAQAGEQVTVALGSDTVSARWFPRRVADTMTTTADAQGTWRVMLPPMKATGPLTLTVHTSAGDVVSFNDVWVGDVWLCSGQSNIDTHLERVYPQYPDEIDRDSTDRVRLLRVENVAALDGPRTDITTTGWHTLSKANAWHFTALGYFLGKRMARETGVVQGIVQSSWGGTPIESWLPADSVRRYDAQRADEAVMWADPDLQRRANEANTRASERWNALLGERDPGLRGHWAAADYDDSQWQRANQYALPVSPRNGFCGTYWLRQHIHVDQSHAGQAAQLLIGTLVDADYTYMNGQEVGRTYYQYPPRRYNVPAGIMHEGDNVLAVRFVNRGMIPKFVPEKPYGLRWPDGSWQPLSEEWLVHDGVQMPQQPSIPTAFQNMAAAAYNGMLAPITPYTFAGAIWYQGESNTDRPASYEPLLTCLMASWRQRFQAPTLPFVIVQLANFMAPSTQPQESNWARLREAQRRAALADVFAESVVNIDLGEANDIHPLRKRELADRVALAFDKLVFKKRVTLSPQPLRAVPANDCTITIHFDQPLAEGELHGFEVKTPEGRFINVKAYAQGSQVTLKASGTMVRYAWKDNPIEADCRAAQSNLPATPFQLRIHP